MTDVPSLLLGVLVVLGITYCFMTGSYWQRASPLVAERAMTVYK